MLRTTKMCGNTAHVPVGKKYLGWTFNVEPVLDPNETKEVLDSIKDKELRKKIAIILTGEYIPKNTKTI